jgi:hypothetical protein
MQYETGKAGDLLLWHSRLVHAAPPNHGTEPISLRPNVIYDFYKHPRPREGLIEDSPLDEIERGDPEVRNGRVFTRRGFLETKNHLPRQARDKQKGIWKPKSDCFAQDIWEGWSLGLRDASSSSPAPSGREDSASTPRL